MAGLDGFDAFADGGDDVGGLVDGLAGATEGFEELGVFGAGFDGGGPADVVAGGETAGVGFLYATLLGGVAVVVEDDGEDGHVVFLAHAVAGDDGVVEEGAVADGADDEAVGVGDLHAEGVGEALAETAEAAEVEAGVVAVAVFLEDAAVGD